MGLDADLVVELYELEESLWRPGSRFDPDYMDDVLAPGAFEFGRSGRAYDRDAILDVHGSRDAAIDIELPLLNFAVHELSDSVVLVTYTSIVRYEDVEVSHRSSVWVMHEGRWRLAFHQGTPTTLPPTVA